MLPYILLAAYLVLLYSAYIGAKEVNDEYNDFLD
jgi:hypothetical protein